MLIFVSEKLQFLKSYKNWSFCLSIFRLFFSDIHVVRTMFKSNIQVLCCNNFKCQNHALEESSSSTRHFRGSKFPREIMFIIYAHPSPFSCGTIRHGWPLCCWCYRYIGCCSTFYPMLLPEYVDSLPNREFPALHIQGDPNQKLQFQIAEYPETCKIDPFW